MADDEIDIEEHDVLDNPVIRRIFPDISIVKKEISQYYEDVPDIKQEPEINTTFEKPIADQVLPLSADERVRNDYPKSSHLSADKLIADKVLPLSADERVRNDYPKSSHLSADKPIADKVVPLSADERVRNDHPKSSHLSADKPIADKVVPLAADERVRNDHPKSSHLSAGFVDKAHHVDTYKPYQSNKIILGTKPKSSLTQTKDGKNNIDKDKNKNVVRIPKVVLQDIGAYIFRNNRYCKDCLILFPSTSELNEHERKAHSLKTRKMHVNVALKKSSLEHNKYKCNICGSYLSNSGNLSRHYKNVHKKKMSFKSISKTNKTVSRGNESRKSSIIKITRSRSKNTNSDSKNVCFHCKKKFPDYKTLIEHIYKILEPKHYSNINLKKNANLHKQIVATTEPPKEKQTKATLREKLVFENQDFDVSGSESGSASGCLEVENDDNDKEINTKATQKKKDKTFTTNRITRQLTKKKISDDENQNFDASGSENGSACGCLEVENDDNEKEINTKVTQKKNDKIFTTNRITRQLTKKKVSNDENQDLETCSSRTLRSKRRHENRDLEGSESQSLASSENNENQLEPTFKKRQKHQLEPIKQSKFTNLRSKLTSENQNSHRPETMNTKLKTKNCNLVKPAPKTMKNKGLLLNSENSPSTSSKNGTIKKKTQSNKTDSENMEDKFVYECVYCTYMLPTARAYYMHVVGKHKVENILRANKVVFDKQCKYCPSECKNETAHNHHLYSYHHDLMCKHFRNGTNKNERQKLKISRLKNPAFRMFESFVLESIIYKCNKCDIHFLSSCIAKDHDKHMELLIHWKCSICRRIFKKHDKHLHLKQHNFSKTLNVCQFNELELSRLLYNCTKCAIHFTEERYLKHYSKCDEETTNSVYCKSCDILVDKYGYESHETHHKIGKHTVDFTVIVADIITVTKNKEIKKRKRVHEQVNCLTFCQTCKCYLTDTGITRKTHVEARCSKITKYTCNMCGLVFTNKSIGTHREHHRKEIGLRLQDFKFFNLKGIQINPLIPEYPHCNNCDVNFVNRNAVIKHVCSEIECLTCSICNIKLSENAYKLHMNFHSYSMSNANKDTSQSATIVTSKSQAVAIVNRETPAAALEDPESQAVEVGNHESRAFALEDPESQSVAAGNRGSRTVAVVDPGSQAVGVLNSESQAVKDVTSELQPVISMTSESQSVKVITSESHIDSVDTPEWQAISILTSESQAVSTLTSESQAVTVMASESRKSEMKSNGHSITNSSLNSVIECELSDVDYTTKEKSENNFVYSCQSCKIAVDMYDKVIEHCQNHFNPVPILPSTLKICLKCSLKFESDAFVNHQKLHSHYKPIQLLTFDPFYFTSDNKTWIQHIFASVPPSVQKEVVGESIYQHECRIKMDVLQKGPTFLTVYKCDKCCTFIDPDCLLAHVKDACPKNVRKHPCSMCGLPFMSSAFRCKHEKIHRRYDSVRIKSYNIVLINREAHNDYIANFINAKKPYVLYQCRTCDGVVEKLQRDFHECNVDALRKCDICKLLLFKDDFDRHVIEHSNLTGFNIKCMKVILFGKKDESIKNKSLTPSFEGKIYDYTLYKCTKCEICENNEKSISKHVCTFDDSKWKCPKCGFYICASHSLKQHTKMHDIDSEFKTENINVISFDLPNKHNLEMIQEARGLQDKHELRKESGEESNADSVVPETNTERIETEPNDNVVSDKNNAEEQEFVALYKCACGLHFMDELNAKTHRKLCNPKTKDIRQNCSKCSLIFNPKELFSHLIAHHGDKNKTYKYDFIESTENEDTVPSPAALHDV